MRRSGSQASGDRGARDSSIWRDRKAIGDRAVAAAELDRERSVFGRLRGQVIERIGVLRIGDEMALVVVDADRPEAVDRHVLDVQLIDCLAVVMGGRDVQIKGVLSSGLPPQATADPIRCRTASTFPLGPNMPLVSGTVAPRLSRPSRTLTWLEASQLGIVKVPGPPGWLTLIASCSAWTVSISFGSFGSTRMRTATMT